MKKKCCLTAIALLMAAPVLAEEKPAYNTDFKPSPEVAPGKYGAISTPVTSKFNLSIGGFVKLDYAYNSVNLGPSGALLPNGGAPKRSTTQAGEEQSILTARQSRVWMKVAGPPLLGAKTNALVEVDFYGDFAASGESPQVRMRHAYGSMDWKNTQLLFGQTADMFAPATPSTIDFRHGQATGTPYQPRVPQIRLTQKVDLSANNSMKFVLGVQDPAQAQDTGAMVSANIDTGAVSGKGYTSDYSVNPNYAAHVMFTSKAMGASPGFYGMGMNNLTLGAFGIYGTSKYSTFKKHVNSTGYGVYAFVPILKSKDGKSRAMTASFEAQAYQAAALNINSATAARTNAAGEATTAAKGYGAYGQIMFYPTQDLGITTGYMRRGAYNHKEYRNAANFEKYNALNYVNVSYDLNAAIRVAVEYEHQYTAYGNNSAGTAKTGEINTGRLAAYYFF